MEIPKAQTRWSERCRKPGCIWEVSLLRLVRFEKYPASGYGCFQKAKNSEMSRDPIKSNAIMDLHRCSVHACMHAWIKTNVRRMQDFLPCSCMQDTTGYSLYSFGLAMIWIRIVLAHFRQQLAREKYVRLLQYLPYYCGTVSTSLDPYFLRC